jgi:dephospho-CoA kinase
LSFKNAIALTGGIATGKSSVCSLLQLYGFKIIDADKVAHQMLETHAKEIAKLFGDEYIADGKVDRKKLGSLIFSNKDERLKLERLLHPLIKEEIEKQASFCESKNIPYIVDIPLFFENRNYDIDEVVVVYCDKDRQLQRLINREGLSKEEAQKRVDAQMDIDEKKELADFVIDNTKNLKYLQAEVDRFVGYIRKKYSDLKV